MHELVDLNKIVSIIAVKHHCALKIVCNVLGRMVLRHTHIDIGIEFLELLDCCICPRYLAHMFLDSVVVSSKVFRGDKCRVMNDDLLGSSKN